MNKQAQSELAEWILNSFTWKGSSEILNEDINTGISAYRTEKELKDGNTYEYHFIYRITKQKTTHIGATANQLRESFDYIGVGDLVKLKEPDKKRTYSKEKLDNLCINICNVLEKEKGYFKLERDLNPVKFTKISSEI